MIFNGKSTLREAGRSAPMIIMQMQTSKAWRRGMQSRQHCREVDHALAARELRQALGHRREAPAAERAFAELIAAKAEVEYGIKLVSDAKAEGLVRRARSLVSLAAGIVQLGQ